MILVLVLAAAVLLPLPATGSSIDLCGTTFYNFGDVSRSSQQLGNIEFYNFSNGTTATRQNLGGIDFYSSSEPSLSGTTQSLGGSHSGTGTTEGPAKVSLWERRPTQL